MAKITINSTRPIVQMALNRTACNMFCYGDFGKGMFIEERKFGTIYKIVSKGPSIPELHCVDRRGNKVTLQPSDVKEIFPDMKAFNSSSPIACNAVRVSSVRDLEDLLNGIDEDMENPDWGWDWREERKLLDELKPYAQKYGKMNDWQHTDGLVRRAKNSSAPAACNADDFDNTPIDRAVREIRAKVPDGNLEGWPTEKGKMAYYHKSNGKKLILAIGKYAQDLIRPLSSKFDSDYIFNPVSYGRGAWGYSITPRASAKRGEFKVNSSAPAGVVENADEDIERREYDAIISAMRNKWRPVSSELHKMTDMLFKRKVGYKTAVRIRDYIKYLDDTIL